MVGDVNLFFNDPDDPSLAEMEVMIAGKNTHIVYTLLYRFTIAHMCIVDTCIYMCW